MSFDNLTLIPVNGVVDVPAAAAWLEAAAFAFRDPVDGEAWHISGTPRLAALARVQRERDPSHFPPGVLVWLTPERVALTARGDAGALARAREFLRWLARRGEWAVAVDWSPPTAFTDADALFPSLLPAAEELADDLTYPPVVSGTLTRWGAGDRQLHVHSAGPLRYEAPGRTVCARVAPATLTRWNAAVAAVDEDDPELPASPPEQTAAVVEIETPDGIAFAMLDAAVPPPSFEALCVLAEEWTRGLEAWDGGPEPVGLRGLRFERGLP